jgi:hypothetical protein
LPIRRKLTKLSVGAGDLAGFTPNGAVANWQCVKDNPPDGDTTYVSSTAVATQDSYGMGNALLSAAPTMVLARAFARQDDSGRSLDVGVRFAGKRA